MTGNKSKVDELKAALEKRRHAEEKKHSEKVPTKESVDNSAELDELSKQITAAEEDAKAHYDKLLRVMAEFNNYKKRSEREKQENIKYSNEKLITDLLPVLDDLDRVLSHLPDNPSKELQDFAVGIELVTRQFFTILCKYGFCEIKTAGEKFNPELHEAIAHVPSDTVESDNIIEEHRKGYMLNGRVLRAAVVAVSKGNNN